MRRIFLTRCLKGIVIFALIWGAVFYIGLVPSIIGYMADAFPEFEYLRLPGVVAVGLTSIPICVAIVAFWKIFSNISVENSFCVENTRLLAIIGYCAVADTAYIFAGFVFLFVAGAVNPGVALIFAGIMIFGVMVIIMAFLLSHLTGKACAMKDEIDLTV